MVWGVCRRVLRSHHDAEDAFQATFLVLIRRAAAIRPRELVANWLYGVAQQTARKARTTAAKRRAREKQVMEMPEIVGTDQDRSDGLLPLLDEELSRLPARYRAVLVLCDLEGKTRKEAARQLACPEGTVASRLATAREMLAKRLARHGLSVSGGVVAALLSQSTASACVPTSVASGAIRASSLVAAGRAAAGAVSAEALVLAEGVLKTMLLTKLKIATAVLVVALLATGAAGFTLRVTADKPADLPVKEKQPLAEKPVAPPVKEKQEPAVQAGPGKKVEDIRTRVVNGVVKVVDVERCTLTIDHKEGESTFHLARDASIEIDGHPGKLAGLPAGTNVTLSRFVDAQTARSLRAEGRWLWGGRVKGIDAEKRTLTIADREGDKTFTICPTACLSVDGKPCNLAALASIPGGASVNLGLCVDQKTARNVGAEGASLNATVQAVDAEKNTLTVRTGRDAEDRILNVAKDANIVIDDKPGGLAGIPAGSSVHLTLHVDQTTVGHMSARGPAVFGSVKAVDAAKNTITVAGPPDDRTFVVPDTTYIVIDGKRGRLAGIPLGANLHALNLCVDQKTARSINVDGPSYHHVAVKAVDAEKNTITFDDKAPADVAGKAVPVPADATIMIDGKPGKLVGMPAGAFVNLVLTVDRSTVRRLDAEGPNLGGCGGSPVKSVDTVGNTITFDDKAAAEVAGKTFSVAKDANIVIDGRSGNLAGLPQGSYVNVTLSVDQGTVRQLHAQGPPVSGVVKAVDTEKHTITVDDKTWTVARDVNVAIDGKRGELSGLAAGTNVTLRLRVDQKTVSLIHTKTP
jgi:RNA polymerase sigma factor (sigma-70 family)